MNGNQVQMEVKENDLRPKIPSKCPSFFAKLIKACWNRNPKLRPSFKVILNELRSMRSKLSQKNKG